MNTVAGTGPRIDPTTFRSVLGHFCSGITVVTALGPDGPLGFTCQSFSSLSLDPPMVLLSPARSSTTWPRIRELGSFCVNVLAEHHEELSTAMSRSGTEKFARVSWRPSGNGAPRLDDAAAWIDCRLYAEHDGGDHTVVVAEVHDLGAAPEARPLLFFRGRYLRAVLPADGERSAR
ncbi:MAG TPA: flavin reductase family protein [Actinomadura sp.]|jgi:flavin reductase (DIM6/NTAB) family NADH-FMN oxidoreductase RutF|nr:flavin reductase family protein [Actinomadura sp.]